MLDLFQKMFVCFFISIDDIVGEKRKIHNVMNSCAFFSFPPYYIVWKRFPVFFLKSALCASQRREQQPMFIEGPARLL